MILVFGKYGQVARSLQNFFNDSEATFLSTDEADFSNPPSLSAVLDKYNPQIVINTSAYTAVDKAESEKERALLVNCESPKKIARWCRQHDAILIHYSTDYVYPGTGQQAWLETDGTGPLNWYGETKLKGEQAIQESSCRYFILRTSWIYSSLGNNFVKTMLKLGAEREELKVVSDQFGAPTYAEDLARATKKMVQALQMSSHPSGVYHIAGAGVTNWHEFAVMVFNEARSLGVPLKVKEVKAILTAEYPTPAKRPLNSRLNQDKLKKEFGIELPNWKISLKSCLRRIVDENHRI